MWHEKIIDNGQIGWERDKLRMRNKRREKTRVYSVDLGCRVGWQHAGGVGWKRSVCVQRRTFSMQYRGQLGWSNCECARCWRNRLAKWMPKMTNHASVTWGYLVGSGPDLPCLRLIYLIFFTRKIKEFWQVVYFVFTTEYPTHVPASEWR